MITCITSRSFKHASNYLLSFCGFLWILQFPPPVKLTFHYHNFNTSIYEPGWCWGTVKWFGNQQKCLLLNWHRFLDWTGLRLLFSLQMCKTLGILYNPVQLLHDSWVVILAAMTYHWLVDSVHCTTQLLSYFTRFLTMWVTVTHLLWWALIVYHG